MYLHGCLQVLETGEEVKLQRNALSVVEYGPEDQQVRHIGNHLRSLSHARALSIAVCPLQESSSDEMTETREPQIGKPPHSNRVIVAACSWLLGTSFAAQSLS